MVVRVRVRARLHAVGHTLDMHGLAIRLHAARALTKRDFGHGHHTKSRLVASDIQGRFSSHRPHRSGTSRLMNGIVICNDAQKTAWASQEVRVLPAAQWAGHAVDTDCA